MSSSASGSTDVGLAPSMSKSMSSGVLHQSRRDTPSRALESIVHALKVLSDSNTNVNSMINRRVSLFYQYPLKGSHHMVCPCTL